MFAGLTLVLFGCGSNNSTSNNSDSTNALPASDSIRGADARRDDTSGQNTSARASVAIEAGLVYGTGPQPVARTQFYLLERDLKGILKATGLEDKGGTGRIAQLAMAKKYQRLADQREYYRKGMTALREHAIDSTTTGFEGKAQIEDISPGTYYLVGFTETRQGVAAWNLKTEVQSGENAFILDQDNAEVAF